MIIKIKSTAQLVGVGLGSALTSLALMSTPAFSASLEFFGTDENAFLLELCNKMGGTPNSPDCSDIQAIINDLKIAEIEGKAGSSGLSGFGNTFSLSSEGSRGISVQSNAFRWTKDTVYNWRLTYETTSDTTGKVQFSIIEFDEKNNPLTYDYNGPFNVFNALGLITRADDGFRATMELTLNQVLFNDGSSQSTDFTLTSVSNETRFDKKFFILNEPFLSDGKYMTELQGTFRMSWIGDNLLPTRINSNNTTRANAQVAFYIKMFDPLITSSVVTTPEPTIILGLLGVGTLGIVTKKRKTEV